MELSCQQLEEQVYDTRKYLVIQFIYLIFKGNLNGYPLLWVYYAQN